MKNISKKFNAIPLYFYLVLLLIFVVFLLSSFLYLTKQNRIEPLILYYFNSSMQDKNQDSLFLPELRNVPFSSSFMISPPMYNSSQDNVERFINELMLGPKNIYAVDILPKFIKFDKAFTNKNNPKTIFIMLKTISSINKQNISYLSNISEKSKENIYTWIAFNLEKYFTFDKIYLLLDKKIIN